tara:strand:- start:1890 stop:3632 length:1743 start_codon:yes stop_codon:yes gene_type:complete
MVEIIAEIANAHQGNTSTALKLVKAAKNSGANAVKFQIYFADDFISKDHSRYDHFKKQSFSIDQWKKLINQTKKIGLKIYCDVLGEQAFELAKSFNVDGYKIHSTDISNIKLLKKILKTKKKIFLSCGGVKITEIYSALKILLKNNNKVILLHGFQSYPTKIEDTNLNRLKKLKEEFTNKVEYGFQDHIAGEDINNLYTCLVSLGFGIKYIEKHITLDRKKKGVDYYSSLEPKELTKFINIIKSAEKSISNLTNDFSEKEYEYRKQAKKMLILKRSIKKGQYVSEKDVEYKRAETDCLEPLDIDYLKGKKLNTDLKTDTILRKKYFSNKIIVIVVARSKSKRLPGKALLKITDKTMLEHLLIRLKKNNPDKKILLCTTNDKSDNQLEKTGKKFQIDVFRGPIKNVLKRMMEGIKKYNHNIVVRVTGDDILIDPKYMDTAINYLLENNLEYVDHKALPSGTETEIFDRNILNLITNTADDLEGTEYLTNYVKDNKFCFKTGSAPVSTKHQSNLRLTIDTKKDFNFVKKFLLKMKKIGKNYNYNLDDIVNFYPKSKNKISLKKTSDHMAYKTSLNLNKYYKI